METRPRPRGAFCDCLTLRAITRCTHIVKMASNEQQRDRNSISSMRDDTLMHTRTRVRKRPTSRLSAHPRNGDNDDEPPSPTPAESDQQVKTVTFKRVARLVQSQLLYTNKDIKEKLRIYAVQDSESGKIHHLSFNVDEFRPEVKMFAGLTTKAKAFLLKPAWLRTEVELKYLYKFIIRLKCFERYSPYIRKELAKLIYYEAYDKDRVIIRQGDTGMKFYFIISGSVLIEKEYMDPQTGVKHSTVVNEIGPGAFFGELALLHEGKRKATIICKQYSEFLTINREDFDVILRQSHAVEWHTRMEIVSSHPYFTDWTKDSLQRVAEGSRIIEYAHNAVIVKDLSQSSDNDPIFLLTQGTCKVVLQLDVLEYNHSNKLVLPPICKVVGTKPRFHTATKWIVIRHLEAGELFGVGEGEPMMSVIASQRVVCLSISKMALSKIGRKTLIKHREMLARQYPSRSNVFMRYVRRCQWNEYKKTVIDEVFGRMEQERANKKREQEWHI